MTTKDISVRWGRIIIGTGVLCCGASPVEAHLVTTGLGPVYDGVAHLALSPADMALVVVLALLAAMRGARQGRMLLALFPAAWLAGGLTGLAFPANANPGWAIGLYFLLAGALVASDVNLPLPLVSALAAVIGALHGFLTGSQLAAALRRPRTHGGTDRTDYRRHADRRAGGVNQSVLGADRRGRVGKLDRRHGLVTHRLEPESLDLTM